MRYAGFFLICCAGGGIGACFLMKMREKRRFYEDLLRLLNECAIYMRYTRPTLDGIFGECLGYVGPVLGETIRNYCAEKKFSLPQDGCYCKLGGLSRDEKREINDFFDGLGKSDAEGQLSHVTLFSERFGERLRQAAEKEKRNGTGCVKIGLLCGIFVCILLF